MQDSDTEHTDLETRLHEVAPPTLAQRPFETGAAGQEDTSGPAEPAAVPAPAHAEPALVQAPPPPPQPEPEPDLPMVDVAAIMRQVRRQISERQGRQVDQELVQALDTTNEQWDKVYEPLHLAPGRSLPGRLWDVLRMRLHQEVRSYVDPMIYRQTELNASIVRALNNIVRRSSFFARASEIEALHDEIIQLREQIRQLQEQNK
jgi:polyhydroxyalkanoate synthesis regulator phasin